MDSASAVTLLLLLGLALGRATATATAAATTMGPRSEDDVLQDFLSDNLLVDHHLLTTQTTQAPHTLTTSESGPPERPQDEASVVVGETAPVEGEADPNSDNGFSTTSAPQAESRTTAGPQEGDRTTAGPQGGDRTTAGPQEGDRTTAGPQEGDTLREIFPTTSEDGSGDDGVHVSATEPSMTTTVKTTAMFSGEEGSGFGTTADFQTTTTQRIIKVPRLIEVEHVDQDLSAMNTNTGTPQTGELNAPQVTEMPKGHVTPDWVIIVGFLVGVAALVLLCVAIATRDRWNSRSQYNQTGVTLQPTDQQRALEMQTFLQEQQPKENGKAEEYTVIPLDELPETYSS